MNIALLGFGIVGKGVYDIVTSDFPSWNIKYVLEKDPTKTKEIKAIATQSYEDIMKDKEIDVVIELIGGKTIAYQMIKIALKQKKHVVTANKAVISAYYHELTELAKENNVSLFYEASVGGAIIVLDPLFKMAEFNQINQIEGIINGSTNFVLSSIFQDNKSLSQALIEAKELGYIETGSTDDMDGLDLLRKINILSMISYHTYINESDIERVSLSSITTELIDYLKDHNLAMKYIASSHKRENQIGIHLEPVILSKDDFYNQIHFEENVISVFGTYHKKQSFIGQGAGRFPTASAVINDLLLLESKEERRHQFKEYIRVNNTDTYRFLVQIGTDFNIVEHHTIQEVKAIKDMVCFARIKGDVL
jgi:homoserine dehydrogenase